MNLPANPLGVVFLIAGLASAAPQPWEDPHGWVQQYEEGRKFRDTGGDEIKRKIQDILSDSKRFQFERRHEFESLLSEVAARKPADWEGFLKGALVRLRKGEGDDLWTRDLDVLSALRRLEGKPQPLKIKIAPFPEAKWEFPALPVIDIAVTRHPGEKEDFHFTFGGDYRGGRQSRWTVLVWNEKGELLPRSDMVAAMGGGMFNREKITDKKWESRLPLESYLERPVPPGRYRGCAVYHDDVSIADLENLGGYVLSFSKPFSFEVVPRTLGEAAPVEMDIKGLVGALPAEGQVKILGASYTKEAHDFIDPESPAGKLLILDWPVVPGLVEALHDNDLTATQLAWGFGILHSISTCLDPTGFPGVVGEFDKRSGGFWIVSKVNGKMQSAGGGFGGTYTSSGGKIDPEAQQDFLKRWDAVIESHIR